MARLNAFLFSIHDLFLNACCIIFEKDKDEWEHFELMLPFI